MVFFHMFLNCWCHTLVVHPRWRPFLPVLWLSVSNLSQQINWTVLLTMDREYIKHILTCVYFALTTVRNRWWWLRGFFICFVGSKPPNIRCSASAIGSWIRGWASNLMLSTCGFIKSRMLNMGTVHRSARWANAWHRMAWKWCQSLSRRIWNCIFLVNPRLFQRWYPGCYICRLVLLFFL